MNAGLRIDAGACELRQYRTSDVDDLAAAANHREVWRNLRDVFPHPYSRSHAEAWIAIASAQDPITDLAIAVEDRVVGGIGIKPGGDVHRFSAEIGYWLTPGHWGLGIATSALGAFAPWIMDIHGLRRLYADVYAGNPASERVLQKCGFQREGVKRCAAFKDGEFVDQVSYALVRVDASGSPSS